MLYILYCNIVHFFINIHPIYSHSSPITSQENPLYIKTSLYLSTQLPPYINSLPEIISPLIFTLHFNLI